MAHWGARDFVGYGDHPPDPRWPGGARLAVNFIINYEEGAEYCPLDGDPHAESSLSELTPAPALPGLRNRNMESAYEYGSRVGVWRLLRLFRERGIVPTLYIVGYALEKNPAVGEAVAALGADTVGHGWRWIDYALMGEAEEREHISRTVDTIRRLTGARPVGWYTGRPSLNTRRLVVEEGGFLYDCDDYNDDLPYWTEVSGRRHLVVPHSLDTNDSRFARYQGLETADQYFTYLRDAFDWLYAEGESQPRMLTVPMHCRLIARPGRIGGLARFLDYVQQHERVWICRREDIARHWHAEHGS